MSVLFEPVKIGSLEIKNRFVRSATYFALSDADGFIGQPSVDLMKTLAENEVGLNITGYAYVLKSGQSFADMNGIQDDDHISGYQKMTKAVHDAGGRIVMQIAHCGIASETAARTGGDYMAVSVTDELPRIPDYGRKPREMNDEDIERIIEAFGQAARRVQEAGFDGVQIHGAHGYLVSQFLSPRSNRREDKWGGSLENRMRFVIEVARAIKKQVDPGFPVMIKLGVCDYLEEGIGLTVEEGAEVAKSLEKEGICLTEVSHGLQDAAYRKRFLGVTEPEKEAYYLPQARVIRAAITGRLSLVGGMRSLPVMEEIVTSGTADCISICRPLIREPGLIKRWKDGDTRPADCIRCGGCFNFDQEEKKMHIYCRQLKKEQE
ncbi:MAG: NADH:flavin oxidoreductase [Deltaproteobacteria bacterium]|nr:NADH:flavin oxidoreductase [Deltaproteobacteria bacterium]